MQKILNYIDGTLNEPSSGAYFANYDPATGHAYSLVPDSDERDVNLAVNAAYDAFASWSLVTAERRSSVLMRLAELIDRDIDKLALAESIDSGKTVTQAKLLDIPRAAANLRFFSTAILHTSTEAHITDNTAINYTERSPIGVAGCISPWNLPLYLFTWKIAPALAAGCTVVAKPSELTPMTAFMFSLLCQEAGLPNGVLNIVHGLGAKAGNAIVCHPQVKAISFTGGTATGKKIAAAAGPMFKKLSLELGGKNPNIVFSDCDFDKALKTSIQSSFSNQGEICLCASRILVERPLYDRFVAEFIKQTKLLTVGDPLDDATTVGALVSADHKAKILRYIDLAVQEGATILTGDNPVVIKGRCKDGFFVAPVVVTGLDQQCKTNQEEIFGPVVSIAPFETEEQAISDANGTTYGLSATVWTENLNRAHRVSAALKSGVVWVNCWMFRDLRTPFGGMKQSGVGREGGWEALKFFTESKNICIKL
ncbi:MAG TPA: aldehyde dehydrogenase [Chryseolinea sp.]|nr:aldehyde dehydrogenase [Chryseolinea sp.]